MDYTVMISILIFTSLLTMVHSYNPIPVGAVIVSTPRNVSVIQPIEYGGNDKVSSIFTAPTNITIVTTFLNATGRVLYILFTNNTGTSSDGSVVYATQLKSVDQLSSIVFRLPFSVSMATGINMTSFSSDVVNQRGFLTTGTSSFTVFSLSGLMQTVLQLPSNTNATIRSVTYDANTNRLFLVTDTMVNSCSGLDTGNLQCCGWQSAGGAFKYISFDSLGSNYVAYISDQRSGIYQTSFNDSGCPNNIYLLTSGLSNYQISLLAIDRGLFFCSASLINANDFSYLLIGMGKNARTIKMNASIVAIHISYPLTTTEEATEETCFHGITYSNYRAAVILAAVFGTIMGLFMCFNALFCIDFIMTKRIIRNLKKQIPTNLLEDRWNRLVEEKYAKLALELHRKKEDPPPPPRRKSSLSGRKSSTSGSAKGGDGNNSGDGGQTDSGQIDGGLQVSNPLPIISAYIRRKSEGYLSRRRSGDHRTQRHKSRDEVTEARPPRTTTISTTPEVHIEEAHENEHAEDENTLKPTRSRHKLLTDQDDEAFL